MKCTACGQECFDNQYPEVVFRDEENCICEDCSIDYEEVNGEIRLRGNQNMSNTETIQPDYNNGKYVYERCLSCKTQTLYDCEGCTKVKPGDKVVKRGVDYEKNSI